MQLTFLQLSNILEKYISDNWTETPVAFENSSFTVPVSDPWIFVKIANNPSENEGLGSKCVRLHGVITVSVYVRYDVGTEKVLDLSDKLAALLQNKSIETILTYTTDILRVGDAVRQMNRIESGWFNILTQTRFETA